MFVVGQQLVDSVLISVIDAGRDVGSVAVGSTGFVAFDCAACIAGTGAVFPSLS